MDKHNRRLWLAAFALGLALRLALLPTDGTFDVQSWKAWAYVCATDSPARIYGSNEDLPFTFAGISRALSGDVANRKVLWNGKRFYVDYPPLTMYYLTVVGKLYLLLDPSFSDTPLLDVLVKLPTLIADMLLALLLWWYLRRAPLPLPTLSPKWRGEADTPLPNPPPRGARENAPSPPTPLRMTGEGSDAPQSAIYNLQSAISSSALPYWLAPGIILALGLGYLDASFTLPLVGSLIMLLERRYLPAWLLFTLAVLTKLQGIFFLPLLLLVTLRERRWRTLGDVAAAGGLAAGLLLPYMLNGRFTQLLAGLSYNGQENFVSGNNANLWWLVSYAHTVGNGGLGGRVELYKVTDFIADFGFSPRLLGTTMYALFIVALLVWLWRGMAVRANIAAAAAMLFYGYTMLLTQAHENHLYPFFAIWLLFAVLIGINSEGAINRAPTRIYVFASIVYFLNLFLFYGLGRNTPIGDDAGGLRMAFGFDLTVPLAAANVLLFAYTVAWLGRGRDKRVGG